MGRYIRPSSLTNALAALAARPSLIPLAGVTDHYPARVIHTPEEAILDLAALPGLRRIEAHRDHWLIPCLATWTDIIDTQLPPAFDALKQAARQVGGMQIQNAATLAGNICNASPAADGAPCLLALQASVELASIAGTRVLPLRDFLLGPRQTARRPTEIVSAIRIPHHPESTRSIFLKLGARHSMIISIAMVAAVITRSQDGRISEARIAVGACSATAQRLPALEAAITGTTGEAAEILDHYLLPLSPIDDIRASAAYRRHAVRILLRRAIAP